MTSNQIAYASQLEQARHNQAFEEETNRHNVETEKLSKEANDINSEKNVITATYNQQMYDLQKQYNDWYSRFSEASTKKKLDLEAEGNMIKQQMADTDESYKMRMADIGYIEADIKKRTVNESKRHNVAMELQTQAMAAMDWWFHDLEVKEKQRANTITENYNSKYIENIKRGQDLTFDSGVISALAKSGLDLGAAGFKIGITGFGPITTLDLFERIIGGRYGKEEQGQEKQENSGVVNSREAEQGKAAITSPGGIEVLGATKERGRAISGKLY